MLPGVICYVYVYVVLRLSFAQQIGATIDNIAITTGSTEFGDGTDLTLTLYWSDNEYSCTLNPSMANTQYSCDSSSEAAITADPTNPYYLKLEYGSADALKIAAINITDVNGNWYAFDDFCIPPLMRHTMDKVISGSTTGAFCSEIGSKVSYTDLAIAGETEFILLYADFNIFGDEFANTVNEAGVRPPNLVATGFTNGPQARTDPIHILIQWDVGLYACSVIPGSTNTPFECTESEFSTSFCPGTQSSFFASYYFEGAWIYFNSLYFVDETNRTYSLTTLCKTTTYVNLDWNLLLGPGPNCTADFPGHDKTAHLFIGDQFTANANPVIIPDTIFDYPDDASHTVESEVLTGYIGENPADYCWEQGACAFDYGSPMLVSCPVTSAPTSDPTVEPTSSPISTAPLILSTTESPTTTTTASPTTASPTTDAPTTTSPTTASPTTASPTTSEPTTAAPTTSEPTTAEPTTAAPTTAVPTTAEPTTVEPTTAEPTTVEPTTVEPTTAQPTTAEPTTAQPTTVEPTTPEPTTTEPTTSEPTTAEPSTAEPTTAEPTTAEPTTAEPTTAEPTTAEPTTAQPTTVEPTTPKPTTAQPTTAEPTTAEPTTSEPTTAEPTTAEPTTAEPTTAEPTTAEPTTAQPTTAEPTTAQPTTASPTTSEPSTAEPTTANPANPTTAEPTTASPTTAAPTSSSPTTAAPTTAAPTTASPTTASPTTASPTTASPTSMSPTTSSPPSALPTKSPITRGCDCQPTDTVAFSLQYVGHDTQLAIVTVSRRFHGTILYTWSVLQPGGTFVVQASSGGYQTFLETSGVSVEDALTATILCSNAPLLASDPSVVGQALQDCPQIVLNSFTCIDGDVCDLIAALASLHSADDSHDTGDVDVVDIVDDVTLRDSNESGSPSVVSGSASDDDASADNAMSIGSIGSAETSTNSWLQISAWDPHVLYILVGLLVTFVALLACACYCVLRSCLQRRLRNMEKHSIGGGTPSIKLNYKKARFQDGSRAYQQDDENDDIDIEYDDEYYDIEYDGGDINGENIPIVS